jgi:hypothetical protein
MKSTPPMEGNSFRFLESKTALRNPHCLRMGERPRLPATRIANASPLSKVGGAFFLPSTQNKNSHHLNSYTHQKFGCLAFEIFKRETAFFYSFHDPP